MPDEPSTSFSFSFLFAAACVALYAWERFNQPRPLRHTTTWLQYHLAEVGYIAASVALYAILTRLFQGNEEARAFFAKVVQVPPEVMAQVSTFSAPYMAALFLTVLLPNLPVLRKADQRIKRLFQILGAIPRRALALSWKLNRLPHEVPERQVELLRAFLTVRGFDPEPILAAPDNSALGVWRQVAAVYMMISETCEQSKGLFRFELPGAKEIHEEFEKVGDIARLAMRHPDDAATSLETLYRRAEKLRRQLHLFVSHVMLLRHTRVARMLAELESMGYSGVWDDQQVRVLNKAVAVGTGITVYFLIFSVVLSHALGIASRYPSVEHAIGLAVSIGIVVALCVAAALLPKVWSARPPDPHAATRRRFPLYWLSAAVAVICWFAVHLLRHLLEDAETVSDAALAVWDSRPWALMAFVIAFGIAFLADDMPRADDRRSQVRLRLAEGAIMGLALTLTMAVVQLYLHSLGGHAYGQIWIPLASAALIGFGLGYFVPGFYRDIRDSEARTRELAGEAEGPGAMTATALLGGS